MERQHRERQHQGRRLDTFRTLFGSATLIATWQATWPELNRHAMAAHPAGWAQDLGFLRMLPTGSADRQQPHR
ncbi:MAG: hypothetical protein WCK86_22980, partial [Planctomycetia bacterium]